MAETTRFDIPKLARDILDYAVANRVLDAADIVAITMEYAPKGIEQVCATLLARAVDYAAVDRNDKNRREVHADLCRQIDHYYNERALVEATERAGRAARATGA
jgi:hypothetical protein